MMSILARSSGERVRKRQNTAALQNVAVLATVHYALASWSAALLRRFSGPLVRATYSARRASISMLIATVWLMPETASVAGANSKLKSRRLIGSVVTAQRVRLVSFIGVSNFT